MQWWLKIWLTISRLWHKAIEKHTKIKMSVGTNLCMSACHPGVCVQDIQLCRPRAAAEQTGAAPLPLVWDTEGSPRPVAPRRTDRMDDSLQEGTPRVKGADSPQLFVKINEEWRWTVPYCGTCGPGSRAPPHMSPHTGPGAGGAHQDRKCTGIPRDPSTRRRCCGRLGGRKMAELTLSDLWPLTPAFSNTGPTSTSAVGVQVVVCRAVRNTLPVIQGGPRRTARALGVVRETGGTGGIAGCEPEHVSVNDTQSNH